MLITVMSGITEDDVRRIVAQVSGAHYSGNITIRESSTLSARRVRFTLRAVSSRGPGARYSAGGQRRTIACCWFAHRDVLRALFAEYPAARVYSNLGREGAIRYIGAEGFEETFPSTAFRNIGSMMYPTRMTELCAEECPYHGKLDGGPYGEHASTWQEINAG